MRRETILGGVALTVVLAAVLTPLLVPGVLASPGADEDPEPEARAGQFAFEEVTVAPAAVRGEEATLTVEARLRHELPDETAASSNVTVLFRATNTDSGLVETEETVAVGTVDDARELPVSADLTVDRTGDYRIDIVVFRENRRVAEGQTSVTGVGTLVPEYARTPLSFERFERSGTIPTVTYAVDDVENGSVRMNVSAYLTNGGSEPTDDVRLRIVAFQSDSNVAADRTTVEVGSVRPGRTVSPSGTLVVPDDYNYRLTAYLISDGVVVDTVQSSANLAPAGNESVSVDESENDSEFEASDFESSDRDDTGDGTERSTTMEPESGGGQPGFTGALALAALATLAALAALRRRDRR